MVIQREQRKEREDMDRQENEMEEGEQKIRQHGMLAIEVEAQNERILELKKW